MSLTPPGWELKRPDKFDGPTPIASDLSEMGNLPLPRTVETLGIVASGIGLASDEAALWVEQHTGLTHDEPDDSAN